MPAYRRQFAYVLLFALVLMGCGLYAAYYNMQKATLWPDDGFFTLNIQDGAWRVKILGSDLVLNKKSLSLQPYMEKIRRWGQENVDKLRLFKLELVQQVL